MASFCVTPDGRDGGIWQSGRGPALVDSIGPIYFEVGNGDWDGDATSARRFSVASSGQEARVGRLLHAARLRSAQRSRCRHRLHRPAAGSRHEPLIAGSKKGIFYVLDGHNLGRMTPNDHGLIQLLATTGGRALPGPAFWVSPSGPTMYQWSESDFVRAFRIKDGMIDGESVAKGSVASKGSPGGSISISADASKPGTGIVWGTITNGTSADHGNTGGAIYAYNAETLELLWSSQQNTKRDRLGTLMKFAVPIVVNGRVYIPTYDNTVAVYGLLGR